MNKLFFVFTFLFCSLAFAAPNQSQLDLDYLALTGNQKLADILYETEPHLIARYETRERTRPTERKISGMTKLARVLKQDLVYKSWMRFYEKTAPNIPLRFLELDKAKYPNLWNWGELRRLSIETDKSLKLYEALHDKPYNGGFLEKTDK